MPVTVAPKKNARLRSSTAKDKRGVDLISDALPFGRLWYVEPNTVVSTDRNSFDGTYDQKFYDANGNFLFEDTGTVHATRISVN